MTEPQDGELSEDDYAAIEAAVMETARGRWFLAEFARRLRLVGPDDWGRPTPCSGSRRKPGTRARACPAGRDARRSGMTLRCGRGR